MRSETLEARLLRLFVLNLVLQVFDGVATYQGLRLGFQEANPILVSAFQLLGIGPTLLLFKVGSCGLLVLLRCTAPIAVQGAILRMLAAVYCLFSLGPWLGKFLSLAATLV